MCLEWLHLNGSSLPASWPSSHYLVERLSCDLHHLGQNIDKVRGDAVFVVVCILWRAEFHHFIELDGVADLGVFESIWKHNCVSFGDKVLSLVDVDDQIERLAVYRIYFEGCEIWDRGGGHGTKGNAPGGL